MQNETIFRSDLPVSVERRSIAAPYPTHSHEFFEIEFILSGQGTHQINGQEMTIGRNSFYLLTPADFHAITQIGSPVGYFNVMFSRLWLNDNIAETLLDGPRPFAGTFDDDSADRFRQTLERMLCEYAGAGVYRTLMLQNLIDIALCDILRHLPQPAPGYATCRSEVQKALQYLEYHFRSPLSLRDLAEYVHLSPSYFSEQFRQFTGRPFSSHLQALRLEYAHNLILSSALPMGRICELSGFGSIAHFNRSFRARYGFSPAETREESGKRLKRQDPK